LTDDDFKELSAESLESLAKKKTNKNMEQFNKKDIVFEDDELLVINKAS
jgi:23S rRNA-/tRNA-specific pseudouridylate synthase